MRNIVEVILELPTQVNFDLQSQCWINCSLPSDSYSRFIFWLAFILKCLCIYCFIWRNIKPSSKLTKTLPFQDFSPSIIFDLSVPYIQCMSSVKCKMTSILVVTIYPSSTSPTYFSIFVVVKYWKLFIASTVGCKNHNYCQWWKRNPKSTNTLSLFWLCDCKFTERFTVAQGFMTGDTFT